MTRPWRREFMLISVRWCSSRLGSLTGPGPAPGPVPLAAKASDAHVSRTRVRASWCEKRGLPWVRSYTASFNLASSMVMPASCLIISRDWSALRAAKCSTRHKAWDFSSSSSLGMWPLVGITLIANTINALGHSARKSLVRFHDSESSHWQSSSTKAALPRRRATKPLRRRKAVCRGDGGAAARGDAGGGGGPRGMSSSRGRRRMLRVDKSEAGLVESGTYRKKFSTMLRESSCVRAASVEDRPWTGKPSRVRKKER
mmetsp:Transcript_11980/g.19340  ORF Transcript_11980/g.19340 Transcript_11980/m.19340 type:complete len:257 (+) Transcript_11980:2465-3235(+)